MKLSNNTQQPNSRVGKIFEIQRVGDLESITKIEVQETKEKSTDNYPPTVKRWFTVHKFNYEFRIVKKRMYSIIALLE